MRAVMKISDDQITKVIKYLGAADKTAPSVCGGHALIDPRLVEEVKRHLGGLPDVREERVRYLRANLDVYDVPPEAIAQKIIGRAFGDQLR